MGHFVGVCLAMLASLAAGVFIQPIAAAGPLVIWLIVMTGLSCRRNRNVR